MSYILTYLYNFIVLCIYNTIYLIIITFNTKKISYYITYSTEAIPNTKVGTETTSIFLHASSITITDTATNLLSSNEEKFSVFAPRQ